MGPERERLFLGMLSMVCMKYNPLSSRLRWLPAFVL